MSEVLDDLREWLSGEAAALLTKPHRLIGLAADRIEQLEAEVLTNATYAELNRCRERIEQLTAERDALKRQLVQAYVDGGCTLSEAREMVEEQHDE